MAIKKKDERPQYDFKKWDPDSEEARQRRIERAKRRRPDWVKVKEGKQE